MFSVRQLGAVLCALAALGVACVGELESPERFEAVSSSSIPCTLDIDVPNDLFPRYCGTVACHEGPLPAAGLDLVRPGVEDRLIGVTSHPLELCEGRVLIDAYEPGRSLLLHKIHAMPPCGDIMPQTELDAVILTRDERACVRAWIYEVATELGGVRDADAGGVP